MHFYIFSYSTLSFLYFGKFTSLGRVVLVVMGGWLGDWVVRWWWWRWWLVQYKGKYYPVVKWLIFSFTFQQFSNTMKQTNCRNDDTFTVFTTDISLLLLLLFAKLNWFWSSFKTIDSKLHYSNKLNTRNYKMVERERERQRETEMIKQIDFLYLVIMKKKRNQA